MTLLPATARRTGFGVDLPWRPGRTEGYAALERAVDRTGYLDEWLRTVA